MGKVYAEKSDSYGYVKYPVSFIYWFPGCTHLDEYFDELPEEFKSLVRRSKKSGSKYLVYAYTNVTVPGEGYKEVYGYSRCMGIDNPRKKYGRDKALGWLHSKLIPLGYSIVKEE